MFSNPETILALALLAVQQVVAADSVDATVTSTQKITLPIARPGHAEEVPANFPSVGFELGFVPGFNDDFSETMIGEIAARMDEPPIIRIGGTSGDILKYNPSQSAPHICLKSTDIFNSCTFGDAFILGPSYFDTLANRFKNAHITLQAPLDPIHSTAAPNKTNTVSFIKQAYKTIGADRIDAIALGNEPNFYEKTGMDYANDALTAAGYLKDEISEIGASGKPDGEKIWEILSTAWEVPHGTYKWSYDIKNIVTAWFKRDTRIKYIAEHYYQFDGKTLGITDHLLNHTDLVAQFKNYEQNIAYARDVAKVPYILSEAGGPLTPKEPETANFAIALWGVNFEMYAMSQGVKRVSLVQRPGVKRALWTPFETRDTPGPRVQAQFYSMPFVTDFIGKDVTGKRGVVNIDLANPVLSAYAMFEGDRLARIAIVNLREYKGKGERKGVKMCLKEVAARNVIVGRLRADEGTAAGGWDVNGKNITYSGQQWSYQVNKGKAHGVVVEKEIEVMDGIVDVMVPDSEAVIIYLQ